MNNRRTPWIPPFQTKARMSLLLCASLTLAGCDDFDLGDRFANFDLDLRGNAPGALDTAEAARAATAPRPEPDSNGLITYPNYQVAVARRGDTVADVANRIGMGASELARFNGRGVDESLRDGEVLALPRVLKAVPKDPVPAPVQPTRPDIGNLAGAAIDRAEQNTPAAPAPVVTPQVQSGQEPIRHKVGRGETAFSVARLYGVSPKSLAEWNGLGSDLEVREGQFLIIPLVIQTVSEAPAASTETTTPQPGAGTATPVPPSASSALPEPVEEAVLPESPNLDANRVETKPEPQPEPTRASTLSAPISGAVLRPYSKKLEGIDFTAAKGTPVKAAASGTVAAITRSTDQVPILVLRHADNLLTVYANISDLSVSKGDRVSAGQTIAKIGPGEPPFLHFEVRRGFEAIDPTPLLP